MFKHLILIRRRLFKPHDDIGGDLGGDATISAPAPAPIEAPAPAPAGPSNMLEAIDRGLSAAAPPADAAPAAGQPRDDLGRFTFKNAAGQATDAEGNVAPDQAAALAAQASKQQPAAPAAPEDLTQMPEGLGPKAQERFQRLANTNREQAAELERFRNEVMPGVQAMQQTWTENQVQPEQFTQAMGIIGALNRGDLDSAYTMLQQQMQQIALLRGKPVEHIDALAGHPDLQQQVSQLLLSEEHALQIAKSRFLDQQRQQVDQRTQAQQRQQQEQQQAAQQQQQVRERALGEVDAFCKQMAGQDLDYAAIEKQLLPTVGPLLEGVPPERWVAIVRQQYQLIKQVAGASRAAPSVGGNPLRPTGAVSGAAKPSSMFDAIDQGLAARAAR